MRYQNVGLARGVYQILKYVLSHYYCACLLHLAFSCCYVHDVEGTYDFKQIYKMTTSRQNSAMRHKLPFFIIYYMLLITQDYQTECSNRILEKQVKFSFNQSIYYTIDLFSDSQCSAVVFLGC